MTRHKLSLFLAVILVVAMVAACAPVPVQEPAGGAVSAPGGAAAPAAPGAAAPSAGGKTRFVSSANFEPPEALHGNPFAPPGIGSGARFVWDPLLDFVPVPELTFHPMLGESFTEDGVTLTVNLRKGVVWSDGEPFTSKDVVSTFMLEFVNNATVWRYLTKVEAPDDFTVVFTWREASPILKQMALDVLIRAPYHLYGKWADQAAPLVEKLGPGGTLDEATTAERQAIREDLFTFKPAVTEIVGTGPYTMGGVTTSEMLLTKNPNFWAVENVHFDEFVIMRYVGQEAYITGAVSGVYDGEQHGMPPDVFEELQKAQPDMAVMWSRAGSQPAIDFNLSRYPMDNVLIRKAIILALDRETVLPITEPGTFPPDYLVTGMVPSFRDRFMSPEFLATLEDYSYNPDKAAEYLTEAGWTKEADGFWHDENGALVELEIASMNSWPIFFMGGDAFAQQLTAFGLKTTFKPMELSAYWQYLDNAEHMIAMDFRGGADFATPWGAYRNLYISGNIRLGLLDPRAPAGTPYELTYTLASGEEVDVLATIDELFYTFDEAKQRELIEILARVTNEFVPFVAMGEKAEPIKIYAPEKKITGFPGVEAPFWYSGLNSYARLIKVGQLAPAQ
jgi:peptide/nickel transport system substrate-binding protein